ncbi:apolipoprotein A-IV-like protein [Lates japonicus]|uniref:Apolipoprotein A-IV-like protein n=1 Tax=Lates japonicus TaxID=270547 RepID=A0AAD3R8A9_LATJO|nr:apolipoprotein A-IV-like protein [Lates japonicus]
MKVLVVLALAVFSVCNANIQGGKPSKSNLEVMKDGFLESFGKMVRFADDSLMQFKQSELGEKVIARISQSADTLNQHIAALRTKIPPKVDLVFTQEAKQLEACLNNAYQCLDPKDEWMDPLARQVEELGEKLRGLQEAVFPHTKAIEDMVMETIFILTDNLPHSMDGMQMGMNQLQTQLGVLWESLTKKIQ